ncbi:MAG: class I SAM-dependent methyltransferase [Clostridia bacterium]|nr:class I SAM-dependent methyltransferase [Clostridia bacterium]
MMSRCGFERYTGRVENYVRYRPGYPKRLIDFLYNEGGFSRESIIADIGSGTGLFSRLLLERGSRVVAIEPDDTMRETSERLLCDEFQRFVAIKGAAENTTLPDHSVHHIACAQSFHWFDMPSCRKEFTRILKTNGTVTLIWNRRAVESDEFASEYEKLIQRYMLDSSNSAFNKLSEVEASRFFGSGCYSVLSLPNQQTFDFEGLKGKLLSDSCIPMPGEPGYDDMIEDLKALFELYHDSGRITMRYETEAYAGRLHIA